MDMKEEMMNDAIDDVIGDEEDDEERLVLENFLWENALEPPRGCHLQCFWETAHLPLP